MAETASPPLAVWQGGVAAQQPTAPVMLGDFSVAVALASKLGGTERELAAQSSAWALRQLEDGAIAFEARLPNGKTVELRTPPQKQPPRAIVASIKRDPRQALAGLWLDGIELASQNVPAGELRFEAAAVKLDSAVATLALHQRALERAEIMDLALAARDAAGRPALQPLGRKLEFMDGEVVAVLGGSEAVAMIEDGRWEAALLAANAGRRISVRNLAWEADTVFLRERPINYGSLRQQLQRAGATCVLILYGRQECLEHGTAGVNKFREALKSLAATCRELTPRLIIAGPPPFEKKTPPLPDLSPHNAALQQYGAAMAAVAAESQALFVDALKDWPQTGGLTSDGLQLNPSGLQALARALQPGNANADALVPQVRLKNRLWHDYWRPSNWAFLFGDRTAQPSSRDHLNPSVRWFPAETEQYRELIAKKEAELWNQARELGGKLP